ncbi:Rap1a/Tai family immunity protein [Escherichia coli]|uniref:Rap1a/Tai family immunity protein n=1 Tax=Escherichia coli TaxID=562 RepID=UPI002FF1A7F8
MRSNLIFIGILTIGCCGSAFATQNQLQSILGGGYNPEKVESAKAILGESTAPNADVRAAILKGYILAYLDQDFAKSHDENAKAEYCPAGSINDVQIKVSEYIIANKDSVNEPFTKLIPDALRTQFPCK